MLSSIKQTLYKPIGIIRLARKIRRQKLGNNKRIYLLNIPSHGNLGDHLISVAEIQFFADNFPQYELVKVSSADLYFSIRIALSTVRRQDILCMTGGGYLGSMYQEEERLMRILRLFPDNKVIVLPQSIYYEPTESGQVKKQKAVTTFHKHNNFYFIARERNTYNQLKNDMMAGKENYYALTPDIALYLKYESLETRDSILWCLRNDGEKNNNSNIVIEYIKSLLNRNEFTQKSTDTYVNYSIPIENEEREVYTKLKEFSTAKLVITDRLHGMIYAAITGTPVVAVDNSTGKVGNLYNLWLKSLPYVRFVVDTEFAESAISELINNENTSYNQEEFAPKYKPIIDAINA